MSEINPTDHKSISAPLFPNEGFREAVRELVGSERDNKRVEAEFSRFMDLTNRVHHVRCMDPVNTKDFFERIQDYPAITRR